MSSAPQIPGQTSVFAPLVGTLVAAECVAGQAVVAGQTLGYIESMKMEHALAAPVSGVCGPWLVGVGELVAANQPLLFLEQQR